MLSTTASYLSVSSNLARLQTATASDGAVKTATNYYLANIGKVTSVRDFVNNYQLFSYAMKAFGLSDMTYAKGLMTKVLEGGVTSSTALANTLSDPRYKAFATVFDFAGRGSAATSTSAATSGTSAKYVEQTLEDTQGQQNKGVQLALYFQRHASSVSSAYGILADSSMLSVVQTAFGISSESALQDIDTQAAVLDKVLNISDLQDPVKVQKLVERFTANYDVASGNTAAANAALSTAASDSGLGADLLLGVDGANASANPANVLLASDSSIAGLSSSLLMSIAGLKLGG